MKPAQRLNKVIGLIESGRPAFGTFLTSGSIPDATWAARSDYDFVVFEQEHDPLDFARLRDSLQYLLDRRAIADAAAAGDVASDDVELDADLIVHLMMTLTYTGAAGGFDKPPQVIADRVWPLCLNGLSPGASAPAARRRAAGH